MQNLLRLIPAKLIKMRGIRILVTSSSLQSFIFLFKFQIRSTDSKFRRKI